MEETKKSTSKSEVKLIASRKNNPINNPENLQEVRHLNCYTGITRVFRRINYLSPNKLILDFRLTGQWICKLRETDRCTNAGHMHLLVSMFIYQTLYNISYVPSTFKALCSFNPPKLRTT